MHTHCELIVERGQIVFAALRRRSQPLKHGPTALTGSGQRKIYRQTGTSVQISFAQDLKRPKTESRQRSIKLVELSSFSDAAYVFLNVTDISKDGVL